MIERKDIQGATIFIDHNRGEIHFSDKSHVIMFTSNFGMNHAASDFFSDTPFGTFSVPGTITGQECMNEPAAVEPEQEMAQQYEPDNVFCNAIDNTTMRNVIKNSIGTPGSHEMPGSYDELLASDDIRMIVHNITDLPHADVLLYLTPKVLITKERLLNDTSYSESVVEDLITCGFLKENNNGELYFTFKGLVVRSDLEKISFQNNMQSQPQLQPVAV